MDEVFSSKLHYQAHEDKLYHELTQPTENLILNRNSNLRNSGIKLELGKNSDGGVWGRQVASIPFVIFEKAIRDGYELNSKDADIAAKEMTRFLKTDIGKACIV